MGDLIEISTHPRHQHVFYNCSGGAMRFEVKGTGNAAIGLSKRIGHTCNFWVFLGNRGRTWVLKECKYAHSVATPEILSNDEFREFWVQFHSNVLCVGRGQENHPFIVYKEDMAGIKYVTFGVVGEHTPMEWNIELSPVPRIKTIKPINGGKPRWVSVTGQLPDEAYIGGYENEHLYIIRAHHNGSLTPGKFVPSEGIGYIPWGGQMHHKEDFEVLCGHNFMWVPARDVTIPTGAVLAGHTEGEEREHLYVGRATCSKHIIPGKVQISHGVCYIPYDDREIGVKDYEVLVVPDENVHYSNPIFLNDPVFSQPIDIQCHGVPIHEDTPSPR